MPNHTPTHNFHTQYILHVHVCTDALSHVMDTLMQVYSYTTFLSTCILQWVTVRIEQMSRDSDVR